jgi:hypothetical protein
LRFGGQQDAISLDSASLAALVYVTNCSCRVGVAPQLSVAASGGVIGAILWFGGQGMLGVTVKLPITRGIWSNTVTVPWQEALAPLWHRLERHRRGAQRPPHAARGAMMLGGSTFSWVQHAGGARLDAARARWPAVWVGRGQISAASATITPSSSA